MSPLFSPLKINDSVNVRPAYYYRDKQRPTGAIKWRRSEPARPVLQMRRGTQCTRISTLFRRPEQDHQRTNGANDRNIRCRCRTHRRTANGPARRRDRSIEGALSWQAKLILIPILAVKFKIRNCSSQRVVAIGGGKDSAGLLGVRLPSAIFEA